MDKENKKKKKKGKISKFIYWLLFFIMIIFVAAIYYLDMLPIKYFMLLVCGSVFILGLFALILLNSRIKKAIRFLFGLFAILLIVIISIVSKYIIDTKEIINHITEKINYKTENYSVIVLEDSSYEELVDLEDEDIGYLDNESQGTKKAINKLDDKIKSSKIDYDDVSELSNDLLKENISAILVEDSFKEILEEADEEFEPETRVLYTFSVKVPESKSSKQVDVTKEPFNIYISGIDTYGKITSVSRSDVNILVTVNPQTQSVLLTDIPRDYYVQLHDTTGYKDKITHAGIYGVGNSVSTIEDLLDININYYVKVNFTSVVKLVDALGGVTVHSDYNFTSKDNYRYYVGDNQVNGARALSFVRERHAFADGDTQRGKNQMYLIEAIANELMSFKSITKFNDLLDTMEDSFETNISSEEISELVKMQIDKMIKWDIESNSLEGEGSLEYTYSYKSQKLYVMIPDVSSVASTKTKISKVMNSSK